MHLAQYNIGRLRYDLDDPRVADFVGGTDMINRIAERSGGFVWKYETGEGGVVDDLVDGDPRVVVNMSVWVSVETLRHFVWNTLHKHFLTRTREWFEKMDQASFVMWWIPAGHRPDLAEAMARMTEYRANGAGEGVFGWQDAQFGMKARA